MHSGPSTARPPDPFVHAKSRDALAKIQNICGDIEGGVKAANGLALPEVFQMDEMMHEAKQEGGAANLTGN